MTKGDALEALVRAIARDVADQISAQVIERVRSENKSSTVLNRNREKAAGAAGLTLDSVPARTSLASGLNYGGKVLSLLGRHLGKIDFSAHPSVLGFEGENSAESLISRAQEYGSQQANDKLDQSIPR